MLIATLENNTKHTMWGQKITNIEENPEKQFSVSKAAKISNAAGFWNIFRFFAKFWGKCHKNVIKLIILPFYWLVSNYKYSNFGISGKKIG